MAAVYGSAATGLRPGNAGWARNDAVARAGAAGEQETARLLNALPREIAVLHDVRVPIPGWKINVDHVVVSGRDVWLVDSKAWRPATYLTVFGRTWRHWRPFPHADRETLTTARHRFATLLPRHARLQQSVVVVHPSSPGHLSIRWYRPKDGTAVTAGGLRRLLRRWAQHPEPADPLIVAQLVEHVQRPF